MGTWSLWISQKMIPLIIPVIYIHYHPTDIITACIIALLSLELSKPEIK
jgi:hypothetical protein